MKTQKAILILHLVLGLKIATYAQDRFTSCSAAFLDNKLVVDKYAPDGKCILSKNAIGVLAVAEATYENDKWIMTNPFDFMVAIRDGNTKTLMMYSTEIFRKVDIAQVMQKCQKGDSIVILSMKDAYALPHNEILVQ